jgi:hypothetical protein
MFLQQTSQSYPFIKKTLFMVYIKKTKFNINGTIIDSNISINCKNLAFLHLEQLDNLITKYDQLQLMVS